MLSSATANLPLVGRVVRVTRSYLDGSLVLVTTFETADGTVNWPTSVRLGGERRLPEWEVQWLSGFGDARPVRIGNAAVAQLQLDVYGEIADAMFQARAHGLPPIERWSAIGHAYLDHLETVWREPDEGIWEVRGPRQHFTHSKVMAWVAFDRAARPVEQLGVDGPIGRWRAFRDAIHADVCRNGFDHELGSFVQAYGSKAPDASLLLLPIVGFLPPTDPRIVGTVRAIEQRLLVDGVIFRYDSGQNGRRLATRRGGVPRLQFLVRRQFDPAGVHP